LGNAIAEPIIAHINSFEAALLDGAVGNAGCSGVVCGERGGRLGMAHFGESNLERAGFLGIVKEGSVEYRDAEKDYDKSGKVTSQNEVESDENHSTYENDKSSDEEEKRSRD
jgi:hypothetical protein